MSFEDQKFVKQLISPGKDIPSFQKNCKAWFHFRTFKPKLTDGNLETTPDLIIDDSRTMGNGPFELLIGREFKLNVWEKMVRTMRLKEIARFTCAFQEVIDYPTVSKALREMALVKQGKPVPSNQHHCSMAAVQGTGYQDLDNITADKDPLCFELELLSVEQPGEYKQDHWAMTDAEKDTAIPILKEEGNTLYKQGNVEAACAKYYEALSYLEGQLVKEKSHCEAWTAIAVRKIPLLLNYAQCKMVQKEYADVIKHCSMVLEIESNNVKALYRRGMAHSATWDVEDAQRDLGQAAKLQPSLKRAVDRELQDLARRVKESDAVERKRLQGKLF